MISLSQMMAQMRTPPASSYREVMPNLSAREVELGRQLGTFEKAGVFKTYQVVGVRSAAYQNGHMPQSNNVGLVETFH